MSADEDRCKDFPPALVRAIEAERRQLQQASAILQCLVIAKLYEKWHEVDIDAGDVAAIVRDLIDRAVESLDLVALGRRMDDDDTEGQYRGSGQGQEE
jgi:hypothetical protein